MMHEAVQWGKSHPYMLGGIVFVVGLLLLWWFGFFAKKQTAGGGGVQDYYAAETAGAMAASADYQSANQTAAAIAGVNAARDVGLAQVSGDVAKTQISGDVARALATTNAEITDKQTASSLQQGLAFIDFQTVASRNALAAHISDNAAAVTTSDMAAQVASRRIVADMFGVYTAGNVAVDTAALHADEAAIAQVPAYAAQFVAGGYSPDYAAYDLANLFGTNSQGVQEIAIQHENSNERAPIGSVIERLLSPASLSLLTVPMSNGPTSNVIPPAHIVPQASNTAAETQGLNAGSTLVDAMKDKLAFLASIGQGNPTPTVGYTGKG